MASSRDLPHACRPSPSLPPAHANCSAPVDHSSTFNVACWSQHYRQRVLQPLSGHHPRGAQGGIRQGLRSRARARGAARAAPASYGGASSGRGQERLRGSRDGAACGELHLMPHAAAVADEGRGASQSTSLTSWKRNPRRREAGCVPARACGCAVVTLIMHVDIRGHEPPAPSPPILLACLLLLPYFLPRMPHAIAMSRLI